MHGARPVTGWFFACVASLLGMMDSSEEGFGGEPEPQSESDMQTEEFVVYDQNQVIPRYVITYRTMATKTTDEVLESYALIRTSSHDDNCSANRSDMLQVWHHQEIRKTQLLCSWWFLVQELWRLWRLKV